MNKMEDLIYILNNLQNSAHLDIEWCNLTTWIDSFKNKLNDIITDSNYLNSLIRSLNLESPHSDDLIHIVSKYREFLLSRINILEDLEIKEYTKDEDNNITLVFYSNKFDKYVQILTYLDSYGEQGWPTFKYVEQKSVTRYVYE